MSAECLACFRALNRGLRGCEVHPIANPAVVDYVHRSIDEYLAHTEQLVAKAVFGQAGNQYPRYDAMLFGSPADFDAAFLGACGIAPESIERVR